MNTLAVVVVLVGLAASAAGETIQGRWKLTAAEDLRADGSVARYPWGRNPVGSIVVTGGSCYLQIMSADTPSFSAATPVGEQMKAALVSTYRVLGTLYRERVRGQRHAEGRGSVAARLCGHGAEAVFPVREWKDVLRPGAQFHPRGR
jgi:hypothetical protein